MLSRSSPALFASSPTNSWQSNDLSGAKTVFGKPAFVLFVVGCIFVLDITWRRTNVSILYLVPLLLVAYEGNYRHLGRFVALLVGLTLAAYQVKRMTSTTVPLPGYFHFALLNRSFVALLLIVVGRVMLMWNRWREEQANPELPEYLRKQDLEISSTLAVLVCAPLIALIGAIDILSPANYNVAILYPIPLLICVWTRSRSLLWITLAVLVALAATAQLVGPGPTDPKPEVAVSLARNRLVAVSVLITVTLILHRWIGAQADGQVESESI